MPRLRCPSTAQTLVKSSPASSSQNTRGQPTTVPEPLENMKRLTHRLPCSLPSNCFRRQIVPASRLQFGSSQPGQYTCLCGSSSMTLAKRAVKVLSVDNSLVVRRGRCRPCSKNLARSLQYGGGILLKSRGCSTGCVVIGYFSWFFVASVRCGGTADLPTWLSTAWNSGRPPRDRGKTI